MWGPQDGGNGMALDSVTDIAGAGAGAQSGVGALGSVDGHARAADVPVNEEVVMGV